MQNQPLNFVDHVAKNYEDALGPSIFEPFAVDLTQRIDFTGTQQILELACGSGRLTKHVAETIPASACFIASDLSPDMLEIAKTKVSATNVNWTIVDMQAIPYEDNHFDLVICQFGLMLVPDRAKALEEIFRVLKKGGKLFFSTWAAIDENKLWSIANDTLNAHLSKQPLQADPGPFSMSDEKSVIDLLKTTGFVSYTVSAVANTAEIASASAAAHGFIQGLPVYYFIQQQAPQLLHEIIAFMSNMLVTELGDQPLKTPQLAWVFTAHK